MTAPDDVTIWDAQAARYGHQEGLERRAIDAAVRLADVRATDAVVDLATGTGIVLRSLAAVASPPRAAIGVDRSSGMLAQVGPLPPGWSTHTADATATGLPAASADIVFCAYLLQLLQPAERLAVLIEARRLLRPDCGARLVLVTPWADRRRWAGRAVHHALSLAARARPASLGGLAPLDPTADLVAAGFACTRRVQLPRGGYPSLVLRAELRR